jgi:hypothetical protein
MMPKVWHGGTYVSLGFAFGGRLKGGYPLAEAPGERVTLDKRFHGKKAEYESASKWGDIAQE